MHTRTAPRTNRIVAALVGAFAAIVLAPVLHPATAHAALPRHAVTIDRQELAEVKAINRLRAARHLPALRIDGTLTRAAGWQSLDMGTKHRFSHTDSLGRDPFARLRAFRYPSTTTYRGENLAAGNSGYAATYRQWLNSAPHKANMLNGKFRAIGIARVYVPGSPYGYYWTTTFGSQWTGAPAR